jgi:glutathione S-transferase
MLFAELPFVGKSMVHSIPQAEMPIRLITIPVSHYCEKIRWALTRSHIPFVEERHMPPFHRFATRNFNDRKHSIVVAETERNMSPINRFVSRVVGGQSVPVLVTTTEVLTSSEEILNWVDEIAPTSAKLYPADPEHRQQVDELVTLFDSVLAPAVRLWTYFYILTQAELVESLWCQGVPWFERQSFPIVFRWMRSNVSQMYIINTESALEAHRRICKIFSQVEDLLSDGQTYLVGNAFSAADLTFATLAAAVVMPNGYGVVFPELSQMPSRMADQIQAFRETRAGQFVLRLYAENGG